MRRNVFIMAMLMMVSLTCGSAFAQGRGREMHYGRHGERREMRMRHDGRMEDMRRMDGYRHGPAPQPDMRPCRPEPPRHCMPPHGGPRLDAYGYVPGWNHRVRYVDGRWGYLRGRDWYWYDVYYEPGFYFSHPVAHFHGHLSPAGKVVAGAVGAAAVGAFIGSLCR